MLTNARSILALTSLLLLALPAPARAVLGLDTTPSATLLVPYFEVSLPKKIGAKPKGITTLFSINNASAAPALTHVTIWSDLAVPVLGFNVYLTGYDAENIDLQSVLAGQLPSGATDCVGASPLAPLDIGTIAHLRALLTGKPSPLTSMCAGLDHGDLIARGYVTADVVNSCAPDLPSDIGYFAANGTGIAANINVIWGEASIIDRQKKFGVGNLMVHLEAFGTDVLGNGDRTFYRRYVGGSGVDGREPLSTSFATRYRNVPKDKLFPQGTTLLVWRDTVASSPVQFPCGTPPSWYPLSGADLNIVAFDDAENPQSFPPMAVFGAATTRTKVGSTALPVTFTSGWIFLGFNGAQQWVSAFHQSTGRNTVSGTVAPLD